MLWRNQASRCIGSVAGIDDSGFGRVGMSEQSVSVEATHTCTSFDERGRADFVTMPSLDRAAIDPDADRVVRKLNRAGHKAYLVGGCVRDLLVGRTPKDFDVATSATPNEIKATFRNSRIIGRRFRLAHVFFGSKIIETATFPANPRDQNERDLFIRPDNVSRTYEEGP